MIVFRGDCLKWGHHFVGRVDQSLELFLRRLEHALEEEFVDDSGAKRKELSRLIQDYRARRLQLAQRISREEESPSVSLNVVQLRWLDEVIHELEELRRRLEEA